MLKCIYQPIFLFDKQEVLLTNNEDSVWLLDILFIFMGFLHKYHPNVNIDRAQTDTRKTGTIVT